VIERSFVQKELNKHKAAQMSRKMVRLFVYGTLKRGFSAHELLTNQGAVLLREARTASQYKLLSVGWFPGMVSDSEGQGVLGELYEVNEDVLSRLDRYENTPHLFARESVELDDGSQAVAYLLASPRPEYETVPNGQWKNC